MKFTSTTAAAAIVLASGVTAQSSSPLELLQYGSRLLTTSCRNAVISLATTSDLAKCVQTQNLLPILMNNATSVIPDINNYLTGLCAAPACTPQVIANATQTVQSACRVDLARFGISNSTVATVMDAYDTAREVACLSTNDTALLYSNMTMIMGPNGTMMMNITRPAPMNMTGPMTLPVPRPMNVTGPVTNATVPAVNTTGPLNMTGPVAVPASNSSSNTSVLCPISLLYKLQAYLGVQFTNVYIDSLLLGANATAYQQILSLPYNLSVVDDLACNDCVAASLEVVLGDYPQLRNASFKISTPPTVVSNTTGNFTTPGSSNNFTVASLYQGFCMTNLTTNMTYPASINQTAYNSSSSTNGTMSILPVSRASTSTAAIASRGTGVATAAGSAVAGVTSAPLSAVTSIRSAISVPAVTGVASVVSASVIPAISTVTAAIPVAAPTKRFVKWE